MATAAGVNIDRKALLMRLRQQAEAAIKRHEDRATKAIAEGDARRAHAIKDLKARLKAVEAGKDDPGQLEYNEKHPSRWRGLHYTLQGNVPTPEQLAREMEEVNRAIRVFEMTTDEVVRLGPKLISELGLGRFL